MSRPADDVARDAHLRAALRHAPDAQVEPPAALDAAILRAARGAATAPRPSASWWSRLRAAWTSRGRDAPAPRPLLAPWAGGLAAVVVATAATLLWWDEPVPPVRGDAAELAGPKSTRRAPEAATADGAKAAAGAAAGAATSAAAGGAITPSAADAATATATATTTPAQVAAAPAASHRTPTTAAPPRAAAAPPPSAAVAPAAPVAAAPATAPAPLASPAPAAAPAPFSTPTAPQRAEGAAPPRVEATSPLRGEVGSPPAPERREAASAARDGLGPATAERAPSAEPGPADGTARTAGLPALQKAAPTTRASPATDAPRDARGRASRLYGSGDAPPGLLALAAGGAREPPADGARSVDDERAWLARLVREAAARWQPHDGPWPDAGRERRVADQGRTAATVRLTDSGLYWRDEASGRAWFVPLDAAQRARLAMP